VSAVTPGRNELMTGAAGTLYVVKCDYSYYEDGNVVFEFGGVDY
jgi:hypothetical protein